MTMHVVVCDDDASTRYVIKRLLVQSKGCAITECADGVEGLRAVMKGQGEVDLLILDIEMPKLNGLEVLEAVRRSAEHQALPVVVLTAERREEVVSRLLQLGVLGYVLKPLRGERLMPLVERVKRTTRAKARPVASKADAIRLDPDHPAILVDGDPAYREYFIAYAERFGPVVPADSALEALAQYRRSPVNLVFVGEQLGIIDAGLLFTQLRGLTGDQPLRLVSIHGDTIWPAPGADDELPRSFVPDVHRAEMRRFLRLTGPLDRVSALVGDISDVLMNAATQVFGMMLDSQVEPAALPAYASELRAAVDLEIATEVNVTVDVHMARQDARRIAARMLLLDTAGLTDDDISDALQELATLLTGRLQARLGERQVESHLGLASFETFASRAVETPEETHGMRMLFRVPAVDGTFAVVLRASRVARREEEAA